MISSLTYPLWIAELSQLPASATAHAYIALSCAGEACKHQPSGRNRHFAVTGNARGDLKGCSCIDIHATTDDDDERKKGKKIENEKRKAEREICICPFFLFLSFFYHVLQCYDNSVCNLIIVTLVSQFYYF